jgi:small subunit ribosomal protein S11
MGKKRVTKQQGQRSDKSLVARQLARATKKKIAVGVLTVHSTYNNTIISLSDAEGNVIMASSAGALGFNGAKKSTPYASQKVGELIGEKAAHAGVKEVSVIVRGVGAGREAAIRGIIMHGITISRIVDQTPVPFNGPRRKKARRV